MDKKINPVGRDELVAAMNYFASKNNLIAVESGDPNIFIIKDGEVEFKAAIVKGQIKPEFNDDEFGQKIIETIMDARDRSSKFVESAISYQIQSQKGIVPSKPRKCQEQSLVRSDMPIRDIQVQELTFDDIRNFLCPAANDKDTFMFLKLCQARNLNPFCNEAFLIPYKDNKTGEIKCSMVVGKEAFMRKAESNPQYKGFKAGIIISRGDTLIHQEGTFMLKGDVLEGGWAEVYRDDRNEPVRSEVSLIEYDQGHGLWNHGKKATMIRKVAIVQAHREAFPSDLSGMYDASEMNVDPAKEIQEAS